VTTQEAAMAQEQTKGGGGGGDDDEFADVLEENAEDFVRAYVQKGGQ